METQEISKAKTMIKAYTLYCEMVSEYDRKDPNHKEMVYRAWHTAFAPVYNWA